MPSKPPSTGRGRRRRSGLARAPRGTGGGRVCFGRTSRAYCSSQSGMLLEPVGVERVARELGHGGEAPETGTGRRPRRSHSVPASATNRSGSQSSLVDNLLVVDSSQRQEGGALSRGHTGQAGDVQALVAAIAPKDAQSGAAARLPQPHRPIQAPRWPAAAHRQRARQQRPRGCAPAHVARRRPLLAPDSRTVTCQVDCPEQPFGGIAVWLSRPAL